MRRRCRVTGPNYTTFEHIPKECLVTPQGHRFSYVYSSIICNIQNVETTYMSLNSIYTMEYYSAEKNNDIMKFAGKWMELENIILSEVTQTQKDKHEALRLKLNATANVISRLFLYLQTSKR
ncbi:hypothetical protein STEG23_014620 [Scotinomys teguina]